MELLLFRDKYAKLFSFILLVFRCRNLIRDPLFGRPELWSTYVLFGREKNKWKRIRSIYLKYLCYSASLVRYNQKVRESSGVSEPPVPPIRNLFFGTGGYIRRSVHLARDYWGKSITFEIIMEEGKKNKVIAARYTRSRIGYGPGGHGPGGTLSFPR